MFIIAPCAPDSTPTPTLLSPVVRLFKADLPIAVFCTPVVSALKQSLPTAVLNISALLVLFCAYKAA